MARNQRVLLFVLTLLALWWVDYNSVTASETISGRSNISNRVSECHTYSERDGFVGDRRKSSEASDDNSTVYIHGDLNVNRKPFSGNFVAMKSLKKFAMDPVPEFVTEVMSEEDFMAKVKLTLMDNFDMMAIKFYLNLRGYSIARSFGIIFKGLNTSEDYHIVSLLSWQWANFMCTTADPSRTALDYLLEISSLKSSEKVIPILLENCRILSILNADDKKMLVRTLLEVDELYMHHKLLRYLFDLDQRSHLKLLKGLKNWGPYFPDGTERLILLRVYHKLEASLRGNEDKNDAAGDDDVVVVAADTEKEGSG